MVKGNKSKATAQAGSQNKGNETRRTRKRTREAKAQSVAIEANVNKGGENPSHSDELETNSNNNDNVMVKTPVKTDRRVIVSKRKLMNLTPLSKNEMKQIPKKSLGKDLFTDDETSVVMKLLDDNSQEFLADNIQVSVHAPDDEFLSDEDVDSDQPEEGELIDETVHPVQIGQGQDVVTETVVSPVWSSSNEISFKTPPKRASAAVSVPPERQREKVNQQESGQFVTMQMVNQMVSEKVKQAVQQGNTECIISTGKNVNTQEGRLMQVVQVKSPSDTTIYAPGLKNLGHANCVTMPPMGNVHDLQNADTINQISNFVERIRIETEQSQPQQPEQPQLPQPSTSRGGSTLPLNGRPKEQQSHVRSQVMVDPQIARAQEFAANEVIQAEQYRAGIHKPQGRANNDISFNPNFVAANGVNVSNLGVAMLEDDEFFHLTCHVDNSLRAKIERGEFIELEKLLPKGKNFSQRFSEDTRMQLVNREGYSYWIPAEKEKINSVHKWEQAFRIYAAIYSKANPSRAYEIWQYIHVITTAAQSYTWDNVAEYDLTFRQLMSNYPSRHWGKIYNQMWNLAMREPLIKFGRTGSSYQNNNVGGGGAGNESKNREKYCWKFNKNKCRNKSCEWEHRCKYCDGWGHGLYNCYKKLAAKNGTNNGSNKASGNATGSDKS